MIPFPNYEPDRATFAPDASNAFTNVLPIKDGWGPFPGFNVITDALPGPCKGATFVRRSNGTVDIYAGTAAKLFRLNAADLSWDDFTRAVGGDYSVAGGDFWSFEQIGNKLIAVHVGDAPQVIDVDTGTEFAALGGSPDQAKFAVAMGFQLGLFSHFGDAARLSLSGYGDPEFWTRFQNGSGRQVLDKGGLIQGAVGDQNGGFVFQQDRIQRLILQPGNVVSFGMAEHESGLGVIAPYSIARAGQRIFFKAEDDFYLLGQPSVPIGVNRVAKTILDSQRHQFVTYVQGAADPINKRIFWRWWMDSASEDESDQIIIYDWPHDRWSAAAVTLQYIFPAATQGYTLGALGSGGLGYTLDTMPYPFGSRVWTGGRPALAAFNTENKMGFFEGNALEAVLETADLSLVGEHRRAFVRGFRPMVDVFSTGKADPNADVVAAVIRPAVTGQVAKTDVFGGERTWGAEQAQTITGMIPARSSGRQHRVRLKIPTGLDWSACLGVEIDAVPEGTR